MYRPERSKGVNNMIVLGEDHSRQREQQVQRPSRGNMLGISECNVAGTE